MGERKPKYNGHSHAFDIKMSRLWDGVLCSPLRRVPTCLVLSFHFYNPTIHVASLLASQLTHYPWTKYTGHSSPYIFSES